ncbi:efflux RND transporter periplasmic adaptor subunit [Simiduia curdlanivorans]|uniref:Efflux RND transporter periplasmic adaptor subunit n=1 Tax=Simiduia curdlanivorans TaxID=1492769 RepID=A0ABV8V3N3_9GAMM|nr:efflux RND transporter periplasmic adaptor subunit [Simiduia curdlanivorans]MDN3637469.1 efflux RND transporter periplasmic adaptor subunit [Simiduia curdlanivorans]
MSASALWRRVAPRGLVLGLLAVGLGLTYLSGPSVAEQNMAPPPPQVELLELQPEAVRAWVSYSGRLAPVQSVNIKPQVSGRIEKVLFAEGDVVKQGQPLFVIDLRPHQAQVQQAKAQLTTAQSRARLAQDELARVSQLIAKKLVAQSVYDTALSNQQVSDAAVLQAQAELDQAALNLEYAQIKAPISGRISRAELTQGNLVDAGASAPVLATIVANDKLFAEFNVDESSYLRFVRNVKTASEMPVEMTLAADDSVVYHGHIASFDNQLDVRTGTIRARALFDNADGALTSGMFATLRLGAAQEVSALLVPERAVGTNQSKKFVMVVDAQNIAQYREVVLGDYVGGQRVVTTGLEAGEKVIVNGLSHVRPGMPVQPQMVGAEAALAHTK